jgi:hypothetical protein
MPAATLEERVTSLERRMSELEGQVGYPIPLVRQVHLDLLGFKEDVDERFNAVDARFDRLEIKVDRMDTRFTERFGSLEAKVDAMPRAVAEIVVDLLKK